MVRQVTCDKFGSTARAELVNLPEVCMITTDDLDFFVDMLMSMAFSDREGIDLMMRAIAAAAKDNLRRWKGISR